MKANANPIRFWSTASFGGNADASSMDQMLLGDHLGVCKGPNGHFFALHCLVESVRGFLAARFVTTVLLLALLIGIMTMVL